MARAVPLGPDDPTVVGEYRITARFDEPGPEDAYLATDPQGTPVVVRLLAAVAEPERVTAAVGPLKGVPAFCVAQVLGSGTLGDRPYVVSEHVDGPTLAEAVQESGVLSGAALHRLAVGTMSAVVAIHQAGVLHGDIRPGTVALGPDGPRMSDFGLNEALRTSETTATRHVGKPAYRAPEEFSDARAGPPADVFAWAATMVFAATGRDPFAGDSVAATVNRVLHDPADLSVIDVELRSVLARCLAKDPADRLVASDVLLRLIGEESLFQVTGQASRRRRRVSWRAGAAFLAGALVAGPAVFFAVPPRTEVVRVPVAPPSVTAAATVAVELDSVPEKTTAVRIDGAPVVLRESADDPVRMNGYLLLDAPFASYVRRANGTVTEVGRGEEPMVSPDGKRVVLSPWVKYLRSDYDYVTVRDLKTGAEFTVNTVRKPLQTVVPSWSRDGTRIVLSVEDTEEKRTVGFVVVDVGTRVANFVKTEYTGGTAYPFGFTPDGQVARGYSDGRHRGLEVYDTQGMLTRTLHWVGVPRDRSWFSPSGRSLATLCPNSDDICVWDMKSGARLATVPTPDDSYSYWQGWFTDRHFVVRVPTKKGYELRIVDLLGNVERVLATVEQKKETVFFRFGALP
ncbi:WD40 repeat domain-containing serine/threonine protein kinase [Herbidospora cretacea]|uniref:WD40 repeat domain-containing serine/threonine protein kinase n=1 Tax=Herbidospora cretacea TaxID=28444 RepID=UPI000773A879|nr:WD40 repeat domain-containing serine/threonine protein kinase [Herbidospora cretacea]